MPATGATFSNSTALVTGGSGFLGSWAVVGLLRQGWKVRTTIRSLEREPEIRAMIAEEVDPGDRLSFHAADLLRDEGWDRALESSDYVLHTASPMPIGEFRGQDVVRPAREGTARVLKAAAKAGVKRVVITSSSAAAMRKNAAGAVVEENIWTDVPDGEIYNYPRAKTFAEQDAWAFIRQMNGTMELATVLPSQIQGPVLGSDYSASVGIVSFMLKGKMPVLPRIGFGIVDVRDLVDLHLAAMISPQAAGERFVASGEFLWFEDIARILRQHFGAAAAKVPTRKLPDVMVRVGALFNREMAQLAPNLGVRSAIDSTKAHRMLGWQPRPAAVSIIDTANSLIGRGLA